MNRLWKQLFGTGISSLVEDVGAQGEWPVHPELLDWLALEFQDSGWNVKRMVKLLVMSAAYRQDSRHRPRAARALTPATGCSPRSRRGGSRPSSFATTRWRSPGLLNREIGGPSVFPYQPAGYYANLQFPDRDYIADTRRPPVSPRRLHALATDVPSSDAGQFQRAPREECTAARNVANTPQQALTLAQRPHVRGGRGCWPNRCFPGRAVRMTAVSTCSMKRRCPAPARPRANIFARVSGSATRLLPRSPIGSRSVPQGRPGFAFPASRRTRAGFLDRRLSRRARAS